MPRSPGNSIAIRLALLLCGMVAASAFGADAAGGSENSGARSPRSVLILPFDMVNTSPQSGRYGRPPAADVSRLRRTQAAFERQVEALPAFRVLEPSQTVEAAIDEARQSYRYLYECNGCEIDLGRQAGADLVMTGWVQKVSRLILNFNAVLRNVKTGAEVAGGSVSMRGDTDESWRNAAVYFARHKLTEGEADAGVKPKDGAAGDR